MTGARSFTCTHIERSIASQHDDAFLSLFFSLLVFSLFKYINIWSKVLTNFTVHFSPL